MAQIYDPEGAARAGYLDRVAPPDQVLVQAKEEAKKLGELSRTAYSRTKTRLRSKTINHIVATLEDDMKSLLS